MRLIDTPFHLFQIAWVSKKTVDERMPLKRVLSLRQRAVETVRELYRAALPLETRLRLHARVMKMLGREYDPTP